MTPGSVGEPREDPATSGDWRSSPRFAAVWRELEPLAARFVAAGHRLYLVGGTVRDLVAGDEREEFDLDATTTATPPEIKRLLQGWADAIWTQGERFGTIGASKRTGDGTAGAEGTVERIFEITTHRAEAYRGDSRKPEVVFSDDVVADLSRRDFTVNAMALEVTTSSPELVDPFGGAADLAARVLRTPLTPAESFSDDPLRMLRAARFVTRYDLVPEPQLVAAVDEMGTRLEIVSAERIRDELDKLLRCVSPRAGLAFVLATGLREHVLPELDERAVGVVEAIAPTWRSARWAAVFESVDARAAGARLRALRSSTADVEAVTRLVALRDRWLGVPGGHDASDDWTDADVRRLVHDAGEGFDALLALAAGRAAVPDADPALRARLDALRERVAKVASTEDLTSLQPELDGAQVMALLEIGPGRDVGRAVAELQELRLQEGPVGPNRAAEHLRQWWTNHTK